MSTFLELTNKVLHRVNEVPLTTSNFISAGGFHATAKDAVNDAIWRINQHQLQWPFNHVVQTETLTEGQVRYSYQSDAKYVDFDTFRIKRNDTFGNDSKHLTRKDYEEYVKYFVDSEYNTSEESTRGVPTEVFQTQALEFGVWPAPDKAYELVYEYWRLPTPLVNPSDTPSIPSQFDLTIVNGAMEYVYDFRGDLETSMKYLQKFEDQINEMRTIYINRQTHLKDTRVQRAGNSLRYTKV